ASAGSADIDLDHGSIMPYLSEDQNSVRQSMLLCPGAYAPPSPNVSYVFTADLLPESGPKRLTMIQRPSERIPLIEQETPDADGNFDPDDPDDTGCIRHFRSGSGTSARGFGNYAFADGHAATLPPQRLRDHPEWVHIFR